MKSFKEQWTSKTLQTIINSYEHTKKEVFICVVSRVFSVIWKEHEVEVRKLAQIFLAKNPIRGVFVRPKGFGTLFGAYIPDSLTNFRSWRLAFLQYEYERLKACEEYKEVRKQWTAEFVCNIVAAMERKMNEQLMCYAYHPFSILWMKSKRYFRMRARAFLKAKKIKSYVVSDDSCYLFTRDFSVTCGKFSSIDGKRDIRLAFLKFELQRLKKKV